MSDCVIFLAYAMIIFFGCVWVAEIIRYFIVKKGGKELE